MLVNSRKNKKLGHFQFHVFCAIMMLFYLWVHLSSWNLFKRHYIFLGMWLFFKMFFIQKCIKIIYIFYFLKIIFDISVSKWSKNTKKILISSKKKIIFFNFFQKRFRNAKTNRILTSNNKSSSNKSIHIYFYGYVL